MKHLIIILLLLIGTVAADDVNLYLGLHTDHLQPGEFNEDNRLVALRVNGWSVGHMINSYDKPSTLFGYTWEGQRENVYYGGGPMLASGYCIEAFGNKTFNADECDPVLLPMAIGYLGVRFNPHDKITHGIQLTTLGLAVNLTYSLGFNL